MSEVSFLWLLILLPIADLAATGFFVYLFWISSRHNDDKRGVLRGRSWLLAVMIYTCAAVTVTFFHIGFLSLRFLLELPPLPDAPFVTMLVLLWLGSVPVVIAAVFIWTRHHQVERDE